MKKYSVLVIIVIAIFLAAFVIQEASAQLIMHDAKYRVVRVDPQKERIELTTLDGNPWRTIRYANITPKTLIVNEQGRSIPLTALRHGWRIRVKGGLSLGLNINADKVVVLRRY